MILQRAVRTAVVGARGYSGLELARLLLRHERARLVSVFGSGSVKSEVASFSSELKGVSRTRAARALSEDRVLPTSHLFATASKLDVVFLATPAEVSLELAPKLVELGLQVIDLSGAFRLDVEGLKKHYGLEAGEASVYMQGGAKASHYGLVPWSGPSQSKLIANPGCYVTSVLMGLLPLLKHQLIEPETLVIDAKSGVSGAGRKASESTSLMELCDDFYPYKVGSHQHEPEILRYAKSFGGIELPNPFFVTELLPIKRGISSAIFSRLKPGVTAKNVEAAFSDSYANYGLVRFGEVSAPQGSLSLKQVAGTAMTQIAYRVRGDQLYLFSMIDNLLKGAASQAVENLNRLVDLPVETGLSDLENPL